MFFRALLTVVAVTFAFGASGGTLAGHVRDMNWYAQYSGNPFGVGYYEFAVNANATNNAALGAAAGTDIFGAFTNNGLAAGRYTVASWDNWWRSAYAFNIDVPTSGNSADVDLRLKATMWGYPAFWDATGYYEFGQTFVAGGPISMIYLRAPFATSYTVTVRTNGPGGTAVGVSRSFSSSGDQRLIYGYGEMPTVAGSTYYLRIRTSSPAIGGVLMQMDPRPDFSDPMPNGCLWLGNGTNQTPYPDRDLGVIIMSDDDGLITDLYTRSSGNPLSGVTSVGQSFMARGVGLISAAFWLADPAAPTYVVKVLAGGPGGAQVGTMKRGKPPRLSADPEMLVTWAPDECPLTPGQTYYVEITRDGGGTFNSVYVNASNPFAYGTAFQNGTAITSTDLAGTLMEEAGTGSATMPSVKITSDPNVTEANRRTNQLTIQWTTDVASDSQVEWGPNDAFYTDQLLDGRFTTAHVVTLSNLQSHTLYHYRVTSGTNGYRSVVSRDFVICTRHAASNLLANPGFEEGASVTTSNRPLAVWSKSGGIDIEESNGGWFFGMKPYSGTWLMQGAVNGSASDGYIFQRVPSTPGWDYTFSARVTTWARENSTYKYDVWNNNGRLIYLWLGIDPTGGTNAAASSVQWTPRLYSHRRWSQVAKSSMAQSTNITVFIHMKGDGVEWHLYGVDDCVLTHEDVRSRFGAAQVTSNGVLQADLSARIGRTNYVEGSSNLTNWQTMATIISSNGRATFQDQTGTNGTLKFYRVRE